MPPGLSADDGSSARIPSGDAMSRGSGGPATAMRQRTAARLAAVQAIYEMELASSSADTVLTRVSREPLGRCDGSTAKFRAGGLPIRPGQRVEPDQVLLTDLVRGVAERRADLDAMISPALSEGWPLERLEAVLRAILRAGAYELFARYRRSPARGYYRVRRYRPRLLRRQGGRAWSTPCSTGSGGCCAVTRRETTLVERQKKPGRVNSRSSGGTSRPWPKDFPGALELTDDAAALVRARGGSRVLAVTTDALVAGVHFLPEDTAADVAAKALRVNLSDLASMGAEPLAYTLALALTSGYRARTGWRRLRGLPRRDDQRTFGIRPGRRRHGVDPGTAVAHRLRLRQRSGEGELP